MLDGRSIGAPPFPYPERGQGGTGQAQQYGLGGPQKSGVGHVHIDNVEVAVQTVPDRGQNQGWRPPYRQPPAQQQAGAKGDGTHRVIVDQVRVVLTEVCDRAAERLGVGGTPDTQDYEHEAENRHGRSENVAAVLCSRGPRHATPPDISSLYISVIGEPPSPADWC